MKLKERKKCPFCYSNKNITLYKLSYNNIKLKTFIKIYYKNLIPHKLLKKYYYVLNECCVCHGIFQKFVPDKKFSKNLYEKFIDSQLSFNKKIRMNIKNFKNYMHEAELITSLLKKNPREISIFEFGSGWGFWSRFMTACNFNVLSCEISKERISFAKKFGIKTIKDLKKIKGKFDFIYSDQVFEHLDDPKKMLLKLYKLLRPNGYINLKFPSAFKFKNKIKIKYYPKKDAAHPLEHINIYNKECIENMIKNTRLKITTKIFKNNFFSEIKNKFFFQNILLKKIK